MRELLIMLVSNPCDPDPRVNFEAKFLAKEYRVKILAWDRECKSNKSEQRDNYDICRVQIKSRYGAGISQLYSFVKYYFKAIRFLFSENPRFVHCHDLDTLLIGYIYKVFRKDSKLVYDAHELYSEMSFKNKIIKRMVVAYEKFLLRKTDLFITVGEVRKKWYIDNGYKNDIVIVGNWKNRHTEVNKLIEKKPIYKILYIGSLNEERNVEYILDKVAKDTRFELIIGGNGSQLHLVEEYTRKYSNISYVGYVKDQKYFEKLNNECDIIYYGLNEKHPISLTAVPNKMFEAIAYNKVFFASLIGEILLFHKKYNIFYPVDTTDENLDNLFNYMENEREMEMLGEKNNFIYNKYNRDRAIRILMDSYSNL